MKQIVLSIVAENNPGVLSRISGLFSRRGYNIDSITACKTQDEKYSRMTIAVSGDDTILAQIKNQLLDIVDVMVKADYEVTIYPTQAQGDAIHKIETEAGDYDLVVCSGGGGAPG